MKKSILSLIIALAVLFFTFGVSANSHEATFSWSLPTHTVVDNNCAEQGLAIPAEKVIYTTVQWRLLGTTTWNEAEAGAHITIYTITNLLPEQTYETRVGSHYEGEPILCWTDTVTFSTPALQPPRPCENLQLVDVK